MPRSALAPPDAQLSISREGNSARIWVKLNNDVFTVFVAMGTLFPTACGTAMVTAGTFGLAGTEVINKLCHRE